MHLKACNTVSENLFKVTSIHFGGSKILTSLMSPDFMSGFMSARILSMKATAFITWTPFSLAG